MKRQLGLVLICSVLGTGCRMNYQHPDRGRVLAVGGVMAAVGALAVLGGSTLDLQCERAEPGCDGPGAALGKIGLLSVGIPTTVIGLGFLSWGASLPAE